MVLSVGPTSASISSGWHVVTRDFGRWNQSVGSHVTALEVAGLVVAAVALLAYVAVNLGPGSKHKLEAVLDPYRIGGPGAGDHPGRTEERPAFAQRLVGLVTGLVAQHSSFQEKLAARLEQGGLPLGGGEFLVIVLCGAVVLMAVSGYLLGLLGVIVGLAAAPMIALAVLKVLADRRSKRFEAQIPDVLKLLAASLRAGFSLMQGMDAVLEQIKDPMASELRRAFAATRLGTPIEDALDAVAERSGSRDFTWAVMAIRIQREVGGNLAEILDTVSNTMTERENIRREVRTLTAEGRISAVILALLPIAIGGMIYMVNRPYISILFHSLGGQLALAAGVLLELVGIWWLHRLVQIEL